MNTLTEQEITDLLIKQHGPKYLCVPQCKTEPQGFENYHSEQVGRQGRMDLWCMDSHVDKPTTIAYEIKISRPDFVKELQSEKWKKYLPHCNEFYFVVSSREVGTYSDIPIDVGLKQVAATGNSIRTIQKATWREIEFPATVMHYILLKRTQIIDKRPN